MVKYKAEMLFGALSTPVRRKMVERLAREGTLSVSQMAVPFRMSLPAVLKHTAVLEKRGVIVRHKKGRVQYCSINRQAFEQMIGWLLFQKTFWDESFVRLEKHLSVHKAYKRK